MTPVAELELYSELAIISETPVPLPECIRTRIVNATAETAQTTNRRIWNGPIDKLLNRTIQTPVLYHTPQHSPLSHLVTR